MKTALSFLLLAPTLLLSAINPNCLPSATAPVLYNEFKSNMTLKEMEESFWKTYKSDARLKTRIQWVDGRYVAPIKERSGETTQVVFSDDFIKTVTSHIEYALSRKYADYVFFPDMGHSHMFIPMEKYKNTYDPVFQRSKAEFYTMVYNAEDTKILYHTAEMLKMTKRVPSDDENTPGNFKVETLPDRYLQQRFYTRNIVGGHWSQPKLDLVFNIKQVANTAHEYPVGDFRWWAGYSISANQNGCFPFKWKGKTYYFDIDMNDPPYSNTNDFF